MGVLLRRVHVRPRALCGTPGLPLLGDGPLTTLQELLQLFREGIAEIHRLGPGGDAVRRAQLDLGVGLSGRGFHDAVGGLGDHRLGDRPAAGPEVQGGRGLVRLRSLVVAERRPFLVEDECDAVDDVEGLPDGQNNYPL